jgi:protein-arginine kinase activator protein McsA
MAKRNAVELVSSGDSIAAEIALQKLAEMVANRLEYRNSQKKPDEMNTEELTDAVLLQPWFLPRDVSNAILRLLPVAHLNKWVDTFEDWGCWRCERKDVIHLGLGLCPRCYSLVSTRLKSSIVRRYVGNAPTHFDLAATHTRKAENARQILATHDVLPLNTGAAAPRSRKGEK